MPVSKTQLNKVLAESSFDPRKPHPFKYFVDKNDAKFNCDRAMELLYEIQYAENSDEKLRQAITLLALARCMKQDLKTLSSPYHPINPNTRS